MFIYVLLFMLFFIYILYYSVSQRIEDAFINSYNLSLWIGSDLTLDWWPVRFKSAGKFRYSSLASLALLSVITRFIFNSQPSHFLFRYWPYPCHYWHLFLITISIISINVPAIFDEILRNCKRRMWFNQLITRDRRIITLSWYKNQ